MNGDITDEFDVVDPTQRKHEAVSDVEGLTSLEDFADHTGYIVPEGPYDTVAGFFMSQLGRIPALDDVIEVELEAAEPSDDGSNNSIRVSMRVSEMDGRRIAWIDMTRLSSDEGAATPAEAVHDNQQNHRLDQTTSRGISEATDATEPGS